MQLLGQVGSQPGGRRRRKLSVLDESLLAKPVKTNQKGKSCVMGKRRRCTVGQHDVQAMFLLV